MAIAAAPAAAEGAAGGGSEALAALGFSKGQKSGSAGAGAQGVANILPKPKTTHPYLVGLIFIVVGVAGIVGSITGTLPAMIAALWDPPILVDKSGSSVAPGFLGSLGEIAAGTATLNPLEQVQGWASLGGNIF